MTLEEIEQDLAGHRDYLYQWEKELLARGEYPPDIAWMIRRKHANQEIEATDG
ncbi:MAG: hypothetical protein J3T61_03265 [Candidatus Brocadiales bacterium]|nr:hypothetical protein [Candidatus Bathyanammoxibius sp.]